MRKSEEDQLQKTFASAQAELQHLLSAQRGAAERRRLGRELVLRSMRSGDLRDRVTGLEEARVAASMNNALSMRIAAASRRIEEAKRCYMAKRMERRQVEVLIEAAELERRLMASRRTQQALDDGHRSSAVHSRF
jgi:flagellar biosynthesis chaperone FliJ